MSYMSMGLWWRPEYDGERTKENLLGLRGEIDIGGTVVFRSPTLTAQEDAALLRRQFAERLAEVLT